MWLKSQEVNQVKFIHTVGSLRKPSHLPLLYGIAPSHIHGQWDAVRSSHVLQLQHQLCGYRRWGFCSSGSSGVYPFRMKWKQQGKKGKKASDGGFSLIFLRTDDPQGLNKTHPMKVKEKPHLKVSYILQALFDSSLTPLMPRRHICAREGIFLWPCHL